MKKGIISIIGLLFIGQAHANTTSVFDENNLDFIQENSSKVIKQYASGVFAISNYKEIKPGCTGFRIAEDKVLTNFHCLPVIHKTFKTLIDKGQFMGSTSNYLFKVLAPNAHREPLLTQITEILGSSAFRLPTNNNELATFLNNRPKEFGYINFHKTIDNKNALEKTSLKITKVELVNETLDYALLTVKNIPKAQKIFTLSYGSIYNGLHIATIGHPAADWMKGFKVYDSSYNCKIVSANAGSMSYRDSNFTHRCDTTGGSSGSPIFNRTTGNVVGLHWAGFNTNDQYNKAISMKEILKEIAWRAPQISKTLKKTSK